MLAETNGFNNPEKYQAEIKGRLERSQKNYNALIAITEAAGSATEEQKTYALSFRNLIAYYTSQTGILYDRDPIPTIRRMLAQSIVSSKAEMVTAMDEFYAAKDDVYYKRTLILAQFDETELLRLQNETVAMLNTQLEAATAIYNTEKIQCDLLVARQLELDNLNVQQTTIIDTLDEKITVVNLCESNIFSSERVENYAAQQRAQRSLATKLAHNEKPIGKIDDVVHDWDVIYQS